MRKDRVRKILGLTLVVGGLCLRKADAAVLGPVYPPPGGVSLAGAGSMGTAGGATWTFSALDLTATDDLYWGPSTAAAPGLAFEGDTDANSNPYEGTELMTFSSGLSDLANGKLVFTGSTEMFILGSGTYFPGTRLTLLVTDTGGGALALTDATTLGLAAIGGVLPITGDFKVNRLVEAQNPLVGGTPYQPAWTMFDSYDHGGVALYETRYTTFNGGFYYTENPVSAVPEPSTVFLFGVGGLTAFSALRRRRSKNHAVSADCEPVAVVASPRVRRYRKSNRKVHFRC